MHNVAKSTGTHSYTRTLVHSHTRTLAQSNRSTETKETAACLIRNIGASETEASDGGGGALHGASASASSETVNLPTTQ